MARVLATVGFIMLFATGSYASETHVGVVRVPSGVERLDVAIHFTAGKSRQGVPVLLLHGATFPSANAAAWKIDGRSWMDELAAAGHDVHALDFLGYGESDRFPEMSADPSGSSPLGGMSSMLTQVESAVKHVMRTSAARRVHLIAHSGATLVAGRYAELHPETLDRLVLFGAPVPLQNQANVEQVTEAYFDIGRDEQLEAFEAKVRDAGLLGLSMFERWADAYLATDPRNSLLKSGRVRVPSGIIAACAEVERTGRLPYDPAKVRVPTLVVQGEWDAVAPPAAGQWLFDRLGADPKRLAIIGRAGHRAHLERNRAALYREIETFLAGDDEPGAQYAVFFEVKPAGDEARREYLEEAGRLAKLLADEHGYRGVRRFSNDSRPGWMLSLSLWSSEAALVRWRERFEHRLAQRDGRQGIFENYRIRVARRVSVGGDLTFFEHGVHGQPAGGQMFTDVAHPEQHVSLVDGAAEQGTHWEVIRDYGMKERARAPRP